MIWRANESHLWQIKRIDNDWCEACCFVFFFVFVLPLFLFLILVVSLDDDTITQMTLRLCIRRLNNLISEPPIRESVYKSRHTSHKEASHLICGCCCCYWLSVLCPANIFWDLSVCIADWYIGWTYCVCVFFFWSVFHRHQTLFYLLTIIEYLICNCVSKCAKNTQLMIRRTENKKKRFIWKRNYCVHINFSLGSYVL